MTEKELSTLVINKIDSTETFEKMKAANKINEDELYLVEGDQSSNQFLATFTLTASESDNNVTYSATCDKTLTDFTAAQEAGKKINCVIVSEDTITNVDLIEVTSNQVYVCAFVLTEKGNISCHIYLSSDKIEVQVANGALVSTDRQTLTPSQQSQARDNISAMDKYNGLTPVECAFSASSVKTFYAKGTFIFPDYTASDFVTMMHFQLLLTGTSIATFEQNHIAAIMPFVEKGMFGDDFWEVATLNNPIIIQDAPITPWITLKFYVSNAANKKVGVKISTSNGYVFEGAYSINNNAFDNSITYNDIYLQTNTYDSTKEPTLAQLEMAAAPTKDMQIATKKYVDENKGTTDHAQLTNRDVADAHPMNAITGLETALEGKVNAEMGKGLSTNDLTTALKANYDAAYTHSQTTHAPSNAERNTIVGIQKNGTDVTINSSTRKVNIVVPTKTSELTNDSGYLTEHQSLNNYALKSDLDDKVDKVTGKSLSTNDFTTAEKDKLAKIAENANAYTLPKAGAALGGVQTGGDVSIANGVISYKTTMPIAKGGTGATTASEACNNINALSKSGGTMTGPLGLTANVHYGSTEPSAPIEGQVFFKQINVAELVYPVGAIYMSTIETSPQVLFGFGTWERIQDTFLLAAGATYEAGSTGGEAEVTLTENEMPTHNHKIWYPNNGGSADAAIGFPTTGSKNTYYAEASKVSSTGGGAAHNNMPPYLAVYCWQRTA